MFLEFVDVPPKFEVHNGDRVQPINVKIGKQMHKIIDVCLVGLIRSASKKLREHQLSKFSDVCLVIQIDFEKPLFLRMIAIKVVFKFKFSLENDIVSGWLEGCTKS